MASAKARLEEELGKLESLLRLLDEYEATKNEQTLLLLSQKLKVIVPELRQLSLDPQYKTPECAPLLVTLGQGVKNAVQRTRGITMPSPKVDVPGGSPRGAAAGSQDGGRLPLLAEPKPLKGFLKKRGDKGLVRNYKLRYFEQRGEKIMYYRSDKPEDLKQGMGWIDLSKMISVEKTAEPNAFDVVTAGRIYHLLVVPQTRDSTRSSTSSAAAAATLAAPGESAEALALLNYWIDGLLRYKQYRLDTIARMNNPSPSVPPSPTSPNSSVWSNMSAVFSEDERPSSVGGSSLVGSVSPSAPLVVGSIGGSSATGARARLVFDEDGTDDSSLSMVEERRDTRSSPAPMMVSSRSTMERPASWSNMLAAAAAPAAAAVAMAVDNNNNNINNSNNSASNAAAAPASFSSASNAGNGAELAALKQALTAAKKEAAESKYLADIRGKEVAAMKNDLRTRDVALDRETERAQVLEEKLHARNARLEALERELAALKADLASRESMLSELRAKGRQSLTGDLARLVASMGTGGGGRQKEVILSLSKELEHEREANEAHQQRVRFLAQQLGEVERQAKADVEMRDVAVEFSRVQNIHLKERLREARLATGADPALLQQLEDLKREYFQALGVGMKLNLAMQGQSANVDVMSLYEQVSDTLPFTQWNKYLSLALALELNPAKHAAITAQINSLLMGSQ